MDLYFVCRLTNFEIEFEIKGVDIMKFIIDIKCMSVGNFTGLGGAVRLHPYYKIRR